MSFKPGARVFHTDPMYNEKGSSIVSIVAEQPGGLGYVISHEAGYTLEELSKRKWLHGYSPEGKNRLIEKIKEFELSVPDFLKRYLFAASSQLTTSKAKALEIFSNRISKRENLATLK